MCSVGARINEDVTPVTPPQTKFFSIEFSRQWILSAALPTWWSHNRDVSPNVVNIEAFTKAAIANGAAIPRIRPFSCNAEAKDVELWLAICILNFAVSKG